MQHLNEEDLILHHYGDDAAPAAAEQHLQSCAECRSQYETLCRVLAIVTDAPVPERSETYGSEVWNRLRWKLGRDRRRSRRTWLTALAAAAVLALVFLAGGLWHARQTASTQTGPQVAQQQPSVAATPQQVAQQPATGAAKDPLLFVVVSDHLDSSERMLVELANADPKKGFDVSAESRHAGELVASNRIYRQTAARSGDARIASLLADIEPILVELSHADGSLSPEELASLQRRIDSKGLLFKVRVLGAHVSEGENSPAPNQTNSL